MGGLWARHFFNFAFCSAATMRTLMRALTRRLSQTPPPRRSGQAFLGIDPAKLTPLQLNAIVPLETAVELSSLSEDGWRRYHMATSLFGFRRVAAAFVCITRS
jgi:hypothetical protein